MLKFKKAFNAKITIISLTAIFLLYSIPGYASALPREISLRTGLLTKTEEGQDRLSGAMASLNRKGLNPKQHRFLNKAFGNFFVGVNEVRNDIRLLSEDELKNIDPESILKKAGGVKVYLFTKAQLKEALKKTDAAPEDIDYIVKNLISHPGRFRTEEGVPRAKNIFMLEAYYELMGLLDVGTVAQWARHERFHLDYPDSSEEKAQEMFPLDDLIAGIQTKVRDTAIIFRSMAHDGTVYDPATHFNPLIGFLGILYDEEDIIQPGEGLREELRSYEKKFLDYRKGLLDFIYSMPTGPSAELDIEEIVRRKKELETFYHQELEVFKKRLDALKEIASGDLSKSYIDIMAQSLDTLMKTLRGRLNAMDGIVEKEYVDINKLIEEKALTNYSTVFSDGIDFKKGAIPEALADKDMILAAIVNILHNAQQLKDVVGIKKITVETRLVLGSVVIRISDNGQGFNEKMLEGPLLDYGSRRVSVTSGQTFREDGTGLGIGQSNLEITMNGGTFEVFSTPGKGSDFIITLPVHQSESSEEILERMKRRIWSLLDLWKNYNPRRTDNRALFVTDRVLDVYFRENGVGNIFNVMLGYLQRYVDLNKRGEPVALAELLIEQAFDECQAVIEHFDNAEIDKLSEDQELREHAIQYILIPSYNKWGITEDDLKSMDNLSPEQKKDRLQLYIDVLKVAVSNLEKDYDRLLTVKSVEEVDIADSIYGLIDTLQKTGNVPDFKVWVVCEHNRERSPIIAYKLKENIPSRLAGHIKVESYGLESAPRELYQYVEDVIATDSILRQHVPRRLPYSRLKEPDLILVMTEEQKERLKKRALASGAEDKIKMVLPGENIEISYGGSGGFYGAFKEDIDNRIDKITLPVLLEFKNKLQEQIGSHIPEDLGSIENNRTGI